MYKNRKYRKSKVVTAQTSVDRTKSVLSPIVENVPAKQRKTDEDASKEPTKVPDEEVDFPTFSQGAIPASQPPTQRRYLSQRSTLMRTQSKTMSRAPNSYFEMVLMKAGAELDEPESYILSYDHIVFVNRFRNQLKNHQDYPQNVKLFMDGLQEAMESQSTTIKLISGCTRNISGAETTVQSQDSMMMNFLMVEFLQTELIEILSSKLLVLAKDDKHFNHDPPLLPLMLSQLKFVATIHGNLLYEKVTEIYTHATARAKREVIAQAEYVLSPSHHDNFVEFLINNIASNEELLNPQTVETFTNMYLSAKIQIKVRSKVLSFMKNGCQTSLFPTFTKFLLKPGCEDDDVLPTLINDLRSSLKFNENDENAESKKIELDTFTNIKQSLTRSKKIFDTWQKVIQNVAFNELRSIDFVILLMLMSIREDKYNYLENLVRRRIKLEHFSVSTLNQVRNDFPNAFDQHAEMFLTMLHTFLKEKNHLIASFAKNCYKVMFPMDYNYQKKILMNLVELACNKSLQDSTTLALEMLKELNMKYSNEMQNCGLLLLPLLDRIGDFTLKQYRTLMELLCMIAYPPPPLNECQMLQDHIDMLVKKQIISRTPLIKKQGVIGMVQFINQIVRTESIECEENIYDMNESYKTVEELPDGRAKEAANYINRIFASTAYCAETLALFYDEMATICSTSNSKNRKGIKPIDRYFLIWLSDLISSHFQNFFIADDVPTGLPLEMQFENCINLPDEDASVDSDSIAAIAIDLSGLCFKPQADSAASITAMLSTFNLLRTLHFIRYDGSLDSVNALLGCAIIIPKLRGTLSEIDIFDEYDESIAKKILNVHFYLVNWYREVISAFSSQDEQVTRKRILLRLSSLIELEITLQRILRQPTADYTPPLCNFIIDGQCDAVFKKPVGRAKKSTKSKTIAPNTSTEEHPETEGMSILATAKSQNVNGVGAARGKSGNIILDESQGKGYMFRQMDPDIISILREKLEIKYPLPEEMLGKSMGLLEFRFILSDLVDKVESIPGVKPFNSGQSYQFINYPVDLINDIVFFMPKILQHFKQLSDKLKTAIESVKGALGNADLFTDEMNYSKICFGYCLQLLAGLFSWSGFDNESEKKLLKELLRSVNNYSVFGTTPEKTIEELTELAFNRLLDIEEIVVDIKSAVHLYHTVISVKRFSKDLDSTKAIRKLCKSFLCRKWYGHAGTLEKGTRCNVMLNELLIGFMVNSDYKRMKNILKLITQEIKFLKKNDDCLKMFPNIHKANFPMLFRCLCECFINIVQDSISEYRAQNVLKKWEQSCEIQNMLLDIVKSLDVPRNFTLFLKYAHLFVKAFLQHGLSTFEKALGKDPERASELLKALQITTRFLHNLCCHSKAIKNTAIVAQIPVLRETIENLVFRVKAALAANNCSSVFFMGNLKNKDLQGDEIRSQTSSLSAQTNDDSEEELPDDDCIDESILNEEPANNEKNNSKSTSSSSRRNNSRSKCF